MTDRSSYNKRLLEAIVSGKSIEQIRGVGKTALAGPSESQIQQDCIKWFALQHSVLFNEGMLFHIANEGIRLGRMGGRAKREGVVKGVADLCLSVPSKGYGALYVEMKKKGTYQSPEQRAWQKACEKYGNKYVVCRSVEEFKEIIESYLYE